ncbi:MAG: hypothetical protein Unbinned5179contig1004_30 [Prokaryotic dsDNA virus sp.]|nr:MAG: hypothetical protein Unbinned5179contig1004_30 [Prokaryotic dsDNA virus sp.]
MEYRLHIPAVHLSSLTTTTVLASIPCDRLARLSKVMISSRTGITHNGTNYSQIAVKNGSEILASRLFNTVSLAALTNEELAVTGGDVTSETCLKVEYDFSASGLAVDCDLILIFELARKF